VGQVRTVIAAIILGIGLLTFHFYSKPQPDKKIANSMTSFFNQSYQWQGRYAPDFEITLRSGDTFVLSDHIGQKVIILNFFATWCEPCMDEMPEFNTYVEKHGEDELIIVGINAGEEPAKVDRFMRDLKVRFPVGIDRDDHVQKLYSVESFPTTVFIGADGRVQMYEVGQIMNSDIAFEGFFTKSMEMIRKGDAIAKGDYLKKLKAQKDLPPKETEEEDDKDESLKGRAKIIAETMYCPCGCSDRLADCRCKTAKDIKERLRTDDLSGRTDEEIIRALNKEFCVKGSTSEHDQS